MRVWCFCPLLLLMAFPADAQPVSRPEQPQRRFWSEPPGPGRDGRLAMPVARNLHLSVGRFSAAEPARRRTHTEPIGRTTEIRRDRGVAAIGISLRF